MSRPRITVARAGADAADPVASWVYRSSCRRFDHLFAVDTTHAPAASGAEAYIRWSYTGARGFFSHRHHRVVCLDGVPVAVFGLYPGHALPRQACSELLKLGSRVGLAEAGRIARRRVRLGLGRVPARGPGLFFDNLYVAPGYRRRGIGDAILRRIAGSARRLGMSTFGCEVEASNTAALNLYRRFGGEVVGGSRSRASGPVAPLLQVRFHTDTPLGSAPRT